MKARFVYESLEFERGNDPKKSMNIGKASMPVNPNSKFAEITYTILVDDILTDDTQIVFSIRQKRFDDLDRNTYYFAISNNSRTLEPGQVGLILWKMENSKGRELPIRVEYVIEWDTDMDQSLRDLRNEALNRIYARGRTNR